MRKTKKPFTSVAFSVAMGVFNTGCSVLGLRSEETPQYSVLETDGPIEIREYNQLIVAKTKVTGSFSESQNSAFRILAGYIFGKNKSKERIAMTAPVTQKPTSEKLAMTAPVTQARVGDQWEMTFTMPSKYTLETLPEPQDSRVEFEVIPSHKVAAIRFTGFWSEKKIDEKTRILTESLRKEKKWKIVSGPRFAGYDPPWTIPLLRRNEVLIDVESVVHDATKHP